MNLYLISQDDVGGWDTYDSAVVAAETEEQARNTHPADFLEGVNEENSSTWTADPAKVNVIQIGVATPSTKAGVICASFNAG